MLASRFTTVGWCKYVTQLSPAEVENVQKHKIVETVKEDSGFTIDLLLADHECLHCMESYRSYGVYCSCLLIAMYLEEALHEQEMILEEERHYRQWFAM